MTKRKMRTEKDSLGEKSVPAGAYYGIETVRAIAKRDGTNLVTARFKHDRFDTIFNCVVELTEGSANDLVHFIDIDGQTTVRWGERFNVIPKLLKKKVVASTATANE